MVGIKLLSVDGHMVHQGRATGTQHVLNLGQLSAGTYIVDVSLEDGIHLRSYFVKNRTGADVTDLMSVFFAAIAAERLNYFRVGSQPLPVKVSINAALNSSTPAWFK